jgi:hypothetical protein
MLQVGYSGVLGLGLSSLLRGRAEAGESDRRPAIAPRAKSVVLVFLTGAPSHHDTFDMKPDAPAEIRGEFKPIATSVPGLQICEHLPRLAAQANRYAIVRTLAHGDNNHLMSTHHVLTGHKQPGAFFDKIASRDDWPSYAAALDYFRPPRNLMPTGVNLPTHLVQSPLIWPGQHAGILGPKHDPWQITGDPNAKDFRVGDLQLAEGIDVNRFQNRHALLDQINRQQQSLAELAESRSLSDQQQMAFSLLTSNGLTKAFEIDKEPAEVRDRYGRHTFGQSLLVARRLVEAGVPVVQVNMGGAQTWDQHGDIFPSLKNRLLPPLDQGLAAMLEDLADRRLLDDTLVMMLGEFGRTPKISSLNGGSPGRDHWGNCFFGLFAGAGVVGGQAVGRSDKDGAYPATKAYSPEDIGATVYRSLGIDPASTILDRFGRPLTLNEGSPIEALFTAAG